jgi:hypothetical protein
VAAEVEVVAIVAAVVVAVVRGQTAYATRASTNTPSTAIAGQ